MQVQINLKELNKSILFGHNLRSYTILEHFGY